MLKPSDTVTLPESGAAGIQLPAATTIPSATERPLHTIPLARGVARQCHTQVPGRPRRPGHAVLHKEKTRLCTMVVAATNTAP